MTAIERDSSRMIDRLVDAELADEDLRHLLQDCDDNPLKWKTLALAFVESQVMTRELSALRDAADNDVDVCRPVTQLALRRWSNVFSIAAIGLLALGFGFGFGRLSNPASLEHTSSPNGFAEFNPTHADQADDSFQFLVSDPDGSLRQVEVPLVSDVNNLTESGVPSTFPRALIEQMERQGRQVEQYRSFVPIVLRDGRDVIVPIDRMRVKQKPYQ